MPSNFNKEDFEKKKSKNKLYKEEYQTWCVNDKVYAKIYFEGVDIDSSFKIKTDYKSVICTRKDYSFFRESASATSGYIIEFYIDRDFEFNSVWENIYTD